MRSLERIVSAYLDLAEDRAERPYPNDNGGLVKASEFISDGR